MEGVIQVLGFLRPESRTLDELIAVSDQVGSLWIGPALSAAAAHQQRPRSGLRWFFGFASYRGWPLRAKVI